MGNLRQSMTDKEWYDEEKKIREDRKNGKPDEILLSLLICDKSVEELKAIKEALSPFFEEHSLNLLTKWISWKSKND